VGNSNQNEQPSTELTGNKEESNEKKGTNTTNAGSKDPSAPFEGYIPIKEKLTKYGPE
jgi:hypothetical protein